MKRGHSLVRKGIVFLGPPGSGKGTQAVRVSSALGIPAISTGEMLRRECESGSSLGRAVQGVLTSGRLVSDALMNQAVANRLRRPDCSAGFLMDGYPRTTSQARYLDWLLAEAKMSEPVVFDFDISYEDVIRRLANRLQCLQCGNIYSRKESSQRGEMLCERDGSVLVQRPDDTEKSIRERLRIYEENASQLKEYYRERDYHRISATRPPAEISEQLLGIIASHASMRAAASHRLPANSSSASAL